MNWERRRHFPPWNIIIYSFIFSRPNILKNERVFFRLLSFLALPQTLFNLVGLVRKIFWILLTFIDVFVFHCLFCFLLYVLLFVVCFCFLFYVLLFVVCFFLLYVLLFVGLFVFQYILGCYFFGWFVSLVFYTSDVLFYELVADKDSHFDLLFKDCD